MQQKCSVLDLIPSNGQSIILHRMLTSESGLNLRKIEINGFVTVMLYQLKI